MSSANSNKQKEFAKKLSPEKQELNNTNDKLVIEALKKKLSNELAKNPALCKKAATIVSSWLNQKNKK